MSDVLEPNDDDILAALDFEPEDPTPTVVDVKALSNLELSNLLEDTRQKLLEMGEMLSDMESTFGTEAGSPEARDLHSIRAACLVEMSERGMR